MRRKKWVLGRWYKLRGGNVVRKASPSRRPNPWATLNIRAEHYTMLRELAEFHQCTMGAVAMALIQEEFIRQVATTDPEKARQLEEEYGPQYKLS
jgi:hypothetical protein